MLSIGTKIGDLEWPWTAKCPLFCVILLNVSGAHCVKVVDKAITGQFTITVYRSNRLQRDRATPMAWIFYNCKVEILYSRFINSRLNEQYYSYFLDIGCHTWAFDWYKNRWPWMTLDGEMALLLRYFTEFGSFRAQCVKVVDKAITMDIGQYAITMSSSKRLQRDCATPTAGL